MKKFGPNKFMGLGGIFAVLAAAKELKEFKDEMVDGKGKDIELLWINGSIGKLLSPFTITPTVIVSRGLREEDIIHKVLNLNSDIFASYYSQSFEILTKIYKLDLNTTFDVLSDSKRTNLSNDNVTPDGLDMLLSDDAVSLTALAGTTETKFKTKKTTVDMTKASVMKDGYENSLLSKKVELNLKVKNSEGVEVTIIIPVNINLNVIYAETKSIQLLADQRNDDKTMSARWMAYRSGGISLKDFIFADDLIRDYKADLIKDEDELIKYMREREVTSATKVKSGKSVGFAKNYAMLIVDQRDAASLSRGVRGDIVKDKYGQKLLDQARCMTLTVVDTDYERLVIINKDIKGQSNIGFKALDKKDGKDSGVGEFIKAMMQNRPPVL